MKTLLAIAAAGEALTGLVLMVDPSAVARPLFGVAVIGAGAVMTRVAAMGLFSMGLACWPGNSVNRMAHLAILTYSLLAAVYLAAVGIHGEWVGPLLWPAVVLHAVLTLLLAAAWFAGRRAAVEPGNFSVAPRGSE